jgi:hypothetical protein
MASTDRQRWARVPPGIAWRRPGLPTDWTPLIEEMPDDMLNPLPPGYVLLDARRDRPLRAWAAHLEFRSEPPACWPAA